MVGRKYFNIREAENVLPRISLDIKRAQRIKELLDRHEQISMRRQISTSGAVIEQSDFGDTLDSEYQQLKDKFYDTIERIEEKGCVVKSIDAGIINFYTKFEGREVFLCWEIGSRKINFWHELDEDFTGRKRILEMK